VEQKKRFLTVASVTFSKCFQGLSFESQLY
jgi:hypothetical protein